MPLSNKLILNEGYMSNNSCFTSGIGSNIYINKKKFLDLSLCAGTLILGHNSNIFKKSIKDVTKKNISNFAATNKFALNFSETLKKIYPKYSKFIFCNSGTDAVTKSLRIARAISKNELIISVTGSWHGSTSELLYSSTKKLKSTALSAGLDKSSIKKIKFIPYNNIKVSKKILNKYKKKIMCLIIEPIQGCLPFNAKKYLKFLSDYCYKHNITLIFDEMITGLRCNGSSIQDQLSLKPSISTFGKCLGGGMPIGIIGVKKNIFERLSLNNKKIFFGGTFSGNSINTYVANQSVKYILKNRKKIFYSLEEKSKYLEENLNNFFKQNHYDASCYRYSSMLRIIFSNKIIENRLQRDFFEKNNQSFAVKFRKYLFSKNIYIASNGIIFLATTTSYENLRYLIKHVKKAFVELN